MEIVTVSVFLFGAFVSMAFCLNLLFSSHQKLVDRAMDRCHEIEIRLNQQVEEFKEVTAKASAANQTLGEAIADFDIKLKELENRIAMVKMQSSGGRL